MIVNKKLSPLQGFLKCPIFPGVRCAHPALFTAAPPARALTGLITRNELFWGSFETVSGEPSSQFLIRHFRNRLNDLESRLEGGLPAIIDNNTGA